MYHEALILPIKFKNKDIYVFEISMFHFSISNFFKIYPENFLVDKYRLSDKVRYVKTILFMMDLHIKEPIFYDLVELPKEPQKITSRCKIYKDQGIFFLDFGDEVYDVHFKLITPLGEVKA